ncbi:uncharacterized protein SCODWIG_02762 [Saccharomycodes ludwigii]|uniref:ATPase expression protein 3 n=1 Tax=Saccharomycodes ludwigii TaxID=36035 RepID=A0A376B8R1_9ASCO|nr:hypothetical protein SCDLUD_000556 [Saccharomycodes ludwigii]KAH3902956.1 hypothetical protein SCDLUD_000556 [Saccharomycodes ludwigii]SSD61001.1 uncharacterized protein SCODWIG_02762 [Saccharomycodes ludwigii]
MESIINQIKNITPKLKGSNRPELDISSLLIANPRVFKSDEISDNENNVINTATISKIPIENTNNLMEKIPKNKSAYLKENIQLVGKGSSYNRKLVQKFLEGSYPQAKRLKTLQQNELYDKEAAKKISRNIKMLQKIKNGEAMLFNKFHKSLADIVSLLVNLTDTTTFYEFDGGANTNNNIYHKESFKEIPPIPNFGKDIEKFEAYIGLLTHTKFHFKSSSRVNGIISKILRCLLNLNNVSTMDLRTVESYNHVIFFFLNLGDFASCREFFVQMKYESLNPNTQTYNLLLKGIVKKIHTRFNSVDPLKEVTYYLKKMKKNRVRADQYTWCLCYRTLLDKISKQIFLDKMAEYKIPSSSKLAYTILKENSEDMTATQLLECIKKSDITLTTDIFNLVVSKLLSEGNQKMAWVFVKHVKEKELQDNFDEVAPHVNVNTTCLNLFLNNLAELGRLDLCFLTFNTMRKKFKVYADAKSYDLLYKCLARRGYIKNFTSILNYIQELQFTYTKKLNISPYWRLKATAIAKYNIKTLYNKDMNEKVPLHVKTMLDNLLWKDGFVFDTATSKDYRHMRPLWRYLGSNFFKKKKETEKCDSTKIQRNTTQTDSIKKSKFKARKKYIAIQNALINKIPYAKNNAYITLQLELLKRGIIQKDAAFNSNKNISIINEIQGKNIDD